MLKRANENLRERLGIKQKDWAVLLGAKPGTVAAAEAINRKSLPYHASMKESEILTLEYATQTAPQKKQSNLEYESSQNYHPFWLTNSGT